MSQQTIPNEIRLHWYADPGHSWLAVPRWLADQVPGWKGSFFSYQSTEDYFFEEDEDAGEFLDALRQHRPGIVIHKTEIHTNEDSFVRALPCFQPTN